MNIRYSKWQPESRTDEQRLEQLVSLFNYMLMQASGDVEETLDWLQQIAEQYDLFNEQMTIEEFIDKLREMGLIADIDGVPSVTNKGMQHIRQDALREVFTSLKKSSIGQHDTPQTGKGVDRTGETRKWAFGDSATNIDLTSTLSNALRREGVDRFNLAEEDLEVYESEHQTGCATVLMVDISHSMILYGEDRITPAKQVALALAELIRTKFPKDFLAMLTFGDRAEVISLNELPFLSVGPYHTNTRAGLQLARNLLRRQKGNLNKQIFMITDGKPSAIFDDTGRLYKNSFGLDSRIVNKTLDEAVQCRRERICISTFMIARDPYLVNFVEEFTKANQGRAFYSSLNGLGELVLVDYLRNRRKKF